MNAVLPVARRSASLASVTPCLPDQKLATAGGLLCAVPFLSGIDHWGEAQPALREREQHLSHLVDMLPVLIWCLTPEGEPFYFNKRLTEWLGLDVQDNDRAGTSRLAATIQAVVHPDDARVLDVTLDHSFRTGAPFLLRYRLRRCDGVYRWVEGRAEARRDREGRIQCWYGFCLDIEDQIRAETALRQSEHQLRQLMDAVPALIWSATPDGATSYVNKRYQEFMGPSLAAAVDSVVHPDDRAAVFECLTRSCATGEPFDMTYRQRRADGTYRATRCRAEPLRDPDGQIVQWYGVVTDIEDEVRAQSALRCARDRLARAIQASSLAQLSASIAHEVNQPLAAVVANAHACQRWLSADPPNLERARITSERIVRDANAASDVIGGIRALFRQSASARAAASINDVIMEVCRLMSEESGIGSAEVNFELDLGLPPLPMDRVQIQQVLVNLIRNAIEASEPTAQGARSLDIRSARVGNDRVRVEVVDRGRGLDDAERIFEPFFTTKSNGMGMGLAICRSIVEAHDGRLWAERSEPRGTRFVFTLPIREPVQA